MDSVGRLVFNSPCAWLPEHRGVMGLHGAAQGCTVLYTSLCTMPGTLQKEELGDSLPLLRLVGEVSASFSLGSPATHMPLPGELEHLLSGGMGMAGLEDPVREARQPVGRKALRSCARCRTSLPLLASGHLQRARLSEVERDMVEVHVTCA